jgi:hypothetical protein
MAITPPVQGDIVSVQAFGIPVANEINRMTPLVVAPTAWTQVAFSGAWVNHSGTHPVKYRKNGDVIEVRGVATGGALNTTMWTFPAGFRPIHDIGFVVYAGTTNPGYVTVDQTGAVIMQQIGTLGGFVYCDTIRFSITA